jgi:hypothetical protein
MADQRYYQAALQVPASEIPDEYTVARRVFEIRRHGGMVAIYLGPVEGGAGEGATVLMATGAAMKVISVLEVILANIGR